MKISYKPFTKDEIKTLLALLQEKKPYREIAQIVGRTKGSVGQTIWEYNNFLHGKKVYSRPLFAIFSSLQQGQSASQQNSEKVLAETNDIYDAVDSTYKAYQAALLEFIEYEAEKRAKEKIAEIQAKYEKELAKMQTILVAAKEESIASLLKKRFKPVI